MESQDRRRTFNTKERAAIWLAADGKSDLSGEPLGDVFHADHVVPFSAGGITDVVNAQALTPMENLMKSDRHVELRNWQKEFLRLVMALSGKDFLLAALPGAGKTLASLAAARDFLTSHPDGKIIVVVPNLNVREQWRKDAWKSFGIALQSKEFRGTLKDDHRGAVTTYQTLGNLAVLFRGLVSRQPTMVILDEVHHCGDENSSWGEAIKIAFENAALRLLLSGTPFRTNGVKIPFVNYNAEGYSIAEPPTGFKYDYPEAIADDIVRVVSFHHYQGRVEYRKLGEEEARFGIVREDANEEEARQHLTGLLKADGDWVRTLLGKAHQQLMTLRHYKRDAGGLVICIDSAHALAVAKVLEGITGERPAIVLSDDDKANSSVDAYRKSGNGWIVAVRQVSEGVDIKRLQVLCYLTNVATELFFRQAVGRVVRREGTDFDEEAYVYIPSDPRLVRMAERIMHWQVVALETKDSDDEERERRERDEPQRINLFEVITSEAENRGIVIDGRHYSRDEADFLKSAADKVGISIDKASRLYGLFLAGRSHPKQDDENAQPTPHPEDRADGLRKDCAKFVGRLHHLTDESHAEIHKRYMETFGDYTPQSEASVKQLEKKKLWLEQQIRRHQ